jgi:hypothetical protein
MNAVPNFRELLSQKLDEVERPRALASGHYIGFIASHEFGVSKNKGTPYVRFNLIPTEEATDIPEGANAGIDLSKRQLRKDFYITPNSIYRLTDALVAILGNQQGRSFDQVIPETRNARVMFEVTQREQQDENGKTLEIYNDVGAIVAA